MYNFYAYMSRMKYINRWCLMRNTFPENIGEHSLEVAMIAQVLGILSEKNGQDADGNKLAVYAMYHDCSEILTGDMPTPVKYNNDEIKNSYKEIEKVAQKKLTNMLPDELKDEMSKYILQEGLTDYEKKLLKAADKLSAYIKCIEEIKAGNMEFNKAKDSLYSTIKDMNLKEVEYFIEEFLPAYELTLDELD